MGRPGRCCVLLLLPIVATIGCGGVAKQSPLMKATDHKLSLDATALTVRARAMVGPVTALIEQSADRVIDEADDPRILRDALHFKIEAVPAMREALFRVDPLLALLDTWAFTAQLITYFETGPGQDLFGEWAAIPLADCQDLEQRIMTGVRRFHTTGDLTDARKSIQKWADDHPITGSIAGRTTLLADAGTIKTKAGVGAFQMVGSLSATLDDLTRQLQIYTSQLPKQARWEAELAIVDMLGAEAFSRSVDQLPALLDTAATLGEQLEDLPDIVARERKAILTGVRIERLETLEFVHEQRVETLAALTDEREAVLAGIDELRVATLGIIQHEIDDLIEVARQERATILSEIDDRARRTVDHAINRAETLVDRVFFRMFQLMVVVFLGTLLLIGVAWLLFRRRAAVA